MRRRKTRIDEATCPPLVDVLRIILICLFLGKVTEMPICPLKLMTLIHGKRK